MECNIKKMPEQFESSDIDKMMEKNKVKLLSLK